MATRYNLSEGYTVTDQDGEPVLDENGEEKIRFEEWVEVSHHVESAISKIAAENNLRFGEAVVVYFARQYDYYPENGTEEGEEDSEE